MAMSKEREAIEIEAFQYWESFVEEIICHNRYNPQHPLTTFLKNNLQQHSTTAEAGTILYRARVIDYNMPSASSTGFVKFMNHEECGVYEGYDEENSFVPPASIVTAGRANPEHIVYLYAAKETITAIGETRPRIFDHVSVAKIQLLRDAHLADFTTLNNSEELTLDKAKLIEVENAFSKPCREEIDYIPTQYVAEFVKSLGYDGIAFRSSYVPGGTNVTIFDPQIAKAIASAPYMMDSITYCARRIFPLKNLNSFEIIATNKV